MLTTTPINTKCLFNATAIVSRKLRPDLSSLLSNPQPPSTSSGPPNPRPPSIYLTSPPPHSLSFLSAFATWVFLDVDESATGGSIYDSELVLRKEPFGGCEYLEAVARALGALEPNGKEIEAQLIGVLRDMVALLTGYLTKPIKHKPQLLKKGKEKRRLKD